MAMNEQQALGMSMRQCHQRTVIMCKDGLFSVKDESSALVEGLRLFWGYVEG
jgi:hypothetical protein